MPITHDDQIDLERVISDPEYRRHVIVYLNGQAPSRSHPWPAPAAKNAYPGSSGYRMAYQWPDSPSLRRFG
jgi:hypothetical protein